MSEREEKRFWPLVKETVRDYLAHPKKLIPTIVLAAVWILLSVLSAAGVNVPFSRFLCGLTYANGGMFGGILGAVGGLLGKVVFAAVVNTVVLAVCAKKNPFKGLREGLGGILKGGLEAVLPFLIGSGVGLVLYCLFNITSSPVNCAVAVAAAAGTLTAVVNKNGLLYAAVSFLMKQLGGKQLPSRTAVSRVLAGFSAGFAVGLPLTFMRLPWLNLTLGLLMILVPILVTAFRKKKGAGVQAAMLLLAFSLIGAGASPAQAVQYDDSYCERSFKGQQLWLSELSPNNFYGQKYDTENGIYRYDWVHQLWDKDHKQLYRQEKYDMTVSMKHVLVTQGEWLDSVTYSVSVADYSTDYLETRYRSVKDIETPEGFSRREVKVSGYDAVYIYSESRTPGGDGVMPYAENSGTLYVPIVDAPNVQGKINTLLIRCSINGYNFGLFDSMLPDFYALIDALPCTITVEQKTEEFKAAKDEKKPEKPKTRDDDEDEDEDDSDEEVIPYRGRLRYTNGRTNKYGQPFPDLMDFDGDGRITWLDSDIQRELSHDPDWLDRPVSKGVGILLAVLTGLLGAAGGAVGGALGAGLAAAAGTAASEVLASGAASAAAEAGTASAEVAAAAAENADIFAGNRYVYRDSDGDLNVTDPATGEKRLYKANGDGTYTNPLTGATYTEGELQASLESREDNAALLRQDEETRAQAVAEQRDANAEQSEFSREIEERARAEQAAQEAAEKKQAYLEQLEDKYDAEGSALRKAILQEQIAAEVEGNRQMANEAYLAAAQKTAKSTEKAADVAIDVLAEVTGEEGKLVKDAYAFSKATLVRGSEAYAEGKSIAKGLVHGAIEGSVNVAQNHAEGATGKLAANMSGDMFKTALEATAKGEQVDFVKVAESGGMAALNTAVDVGFDAAGDLVKEGAGLGEKAVTTAFETVITSEGAANAAKAGLNDLAKAGVESLFKTEES